MLKTILILLVGMYLCSCTITQPKGTSSKMPCDSLLGKSYAFVYDAAASIMEGQMLTSTKYKEGNEFEVLSKHNFKGGIYSFNFFQKETPDWFAFEKDSNYVFLIFPEYEDSVFSPCLLFSKKDKMEGLLSHAEKQCIVATPTTPKINCDKKVDFVCGCNGVEYVNACYAERKGINTYSYGKCLTPKQ